MKTLKEIHAERIIKECDNMLIKLSEYIEIVMIHFEDGKITACKARKEYNKYMKRVIFYNHISYNICNKYFLERKKDIGDFSKFVNYFEC